MVKFSKVMKNISKGLMTIKQNNDTVDIVMGVTFVMKSLTRKLESKEN